MNKSKRTYSVNYTLTATRTTLFKQQKWTLRWFLDITPNVFRLHLRSRNRSLRQISRFCLLESWITKSSRMTGCVNSEMSAYSDSYKVVQSGLLSMLRKKQCMTYSLCMHRALVTVAVAENQNACLEGQTSAPHSKWVSTTSLTASTDKKTCFDGGRIFSSPARMNLTQSRTHVRCKKLIQ